MLKRCMDLGLGIPVLLLASPFILAAAMAVRSTMGRPVIFRQERAGYMGQPFTLFKFRSMTNERDAYGHLLADDRRLTTVGKLLRATSIDELPQLVNVLKGDMSFVGPRPLPVHYLERYNERQALRHDVRPGVTGLVQATYRGKGRDWEERLELDVQYVENQTLLLDLRILIGTFYALLLRSFYRKSRESNSCTEFYGTIEGNSETH